MTHDPIIVSIPHSGTRFLKRRLGIEDHVHTNTNWNLIMERIGERSIITPLRSPREVWRSWCRRRHGETVLKWVPHFFAAWYILHTLDQLREIDFICIDKREDERIKDWGRIGDGDGTHSGWQLHDVDLRVLYKLPLVQQHFAGMRL